MEGTVGFRLNGRFRLKGSRRGKIELVKLALPLHAPFSERNDHQCISLLLVILHTLEIGLSFRMFARQMNGRMCKGVI